MEDTCLCEDATAGKRRERNTEGRRKARRAGTSIPCHCCAGRNDGDSEGMLRALLRSSAALPLFDLGNAAEIVSGGLGEFAALE